MSFTEEEQVFNQLRSIQKARHANLKPLQLSVSGGKLNAELRYAFAFRGYPRYVEYNCLNADGTSALLVNGVINFPITKHKNKGYILITSVDTETRAMCLFQRDNAVMKVDAPSGQYECRWFESHELKEPDIGRVFGYDGSELVELWVVRGQSKEQELAGEVLKHELIAGSKAVGFIYPEGSWRGGAIALIKRWFCNRITLFEYSDQLPAVLEKSGLRGRESFLIGLVGSLTLHRLLSPFFNS